MHGMVRRAMYAIDGCNNLIRFQSHTVSACSFSLYWLDGETVEVIFAPMYPQTVWSDRYFRSGVVNAVCLESTTKTANKLAGSLSLAFSLTT